MENDLDEITPLDFLQAVYLNPNLPLTRQDESGDRSSSLQAFEAQRDCDC